MDILKCKAFVTAADEGSFTAAGKIMGYTPSGISQLVAAMAMVLYLPARVNISTLLP